MDDRILREQLIQVLTGRNAHFTFNDAVMDFPIDKINDQPPNVPYTPWHLVEHLRITQWDILEFTLNPEHVSPKWPEEYWPDRQATADAKAWQASIAAFRSDLKAMEEIVRDQVIDLTSEIPHAPGYTYLREVLLVADHNAYHIGEFCILRQVMGTW
jgi:hypothetical protein